MEKPSPNRKPSFKVLFFHLLIRVLLFVHTPLLQIFFALRPGHEGLAKFDPAGSVLRGRRL
jgi:hypothetical protein